MVRAPRPVRLLWWTRLLAAVAVVTMAVAAVTIVVSLRADDSDQDSRAGGGEDEAAGQHGLQDGRSRDQVLAIFDALAGAWDDARDAIASVPGDSADHLRDATASYLQALERASVEFDALVVPVAAQEPVRAAVALVDEQAALLTGALDALAAGDDASFAAHVADLGRSARQLGSVRTDVIRALSA